MTRTARRSGLAVAALLCAALVTTSCTSPAGDAGRSTRASAPSSVSVTVESAGSTAAPTEPEVITAALPLRGLYGFANYSPQVNGTSMTFSTVDSCPDVIGLLGAGRWSADVFMTPADVPEQARALMPWFYVALRAGDDHAVMRLAESDFGCEGRITPASHESVTITGAESITGPALFQPLQCDPAIMIPGELQVAGAYDLDGGQSAFINLAIPTEPGHHTLETSSSYPVISIIRAERGGIAAYVERLIAEFDTTYSVDADATADDDASSDTGPRSAPGVSEYFADSDGAVAEVDIDSLNPLVGRFDVRGLRDSNGHSLSASGSFYCDTSAITAPSTNGDAGDLAENEMQDESEVPGPGSVTVNISSGPLAGAHTANGALKCEYGLSTPSSWWLFLSPADGSDGSAADLGREDLRMLMLWAAPSAELADAPLALYDATFLLDLGFGKYIAERSQQIHIGGTSGGSWGSPARDGSIVSVSATTADGVDVSLVARCPEVTEN